MIVMPRSLRMAAYPINTRNDIRSAIAPAYGFGSQTAFPKIVPRQQIPAENAEYREKKGLP